MQYFFTPIHMNVFERIPNCAGSNENKYFFYVLVFTQYRIIAGGKNAQGCLYHTVCHMTILNYQFLRPSRTSFFSDHRPQLNPLNQFLSPNKNLTSSMHSCRDNPRRKLLKMIARKCYELIIFFQVTVNHTAVRQNILSTVMLQALEMSGCIWQDQKYASSETYRSIVVL